MPVRTMIRVIVPVETGNSALKSGHLQKVIGEAIQRMKPEAAYFTADRGTRTAYFVVDMQDQSQMPLYGEPFFQELHASVEFMPVMTADDLKSALSAMR